MFKLKAIIISVICFYFIVTSNAVLHALDSNFNIFKITGVSKNHHGLLKTDKSSNIFKKGSLSLINSLTNKVIIEIQYNEAAIEEPEYNKSALKDPEIDKKDDFDTKKSNFYNLEYKDQNYIIKGDFNFDGIDDYALLDGYKSFSNAPSYKIYLAKIYSNENKKEIKYIFNSAFSGLSSKYSGMFNYNSLEKKIYTSIQEGHCQYEYFEFSVKENTPVLSKITKETLTPPYMTITAIDYTSKTAKTSITKTINTDQDGIENIMSFRLEKNNNIVFIFIGLKGLLNCCLIDEKGFVLAECPQAGSESGDKNFTLFQKKSMSLLVFSHKSDKYEVFMQNNKDNTIEAGLIVTASGKYFNLKGSADSVKGSLNKIKNADLLNVIYK